MSAAMQGFRDIVEMQRGHHVSICALHLAQASIDNYKTAWCTFSDYEQSLFTLLAETQVPIVTNVDIEVERQKAYLIAKLGYKEYFRLCGEGI